jgi:dihydrofolate reductase
MRKLIVSEWMSLDGVVQAPSYPDEDRSSGFAHGGWHSSFFDDVSMRWVVQTVAAAGVYLLGRRTYEIFAAHWPHASPEERPLSEPLNSRREYVASKTLREPLAWSNSSLLAGSVPSAVAALKGEDGGDILVIGSTQLVQTLLAHDLVDELRLMIDPVLLGGGKRFFPVDGELRHLTASGVTPTRTGALLATYLRERR